MFALIAAAALLASDNPPAAPDDTQAAYIAARAHAGRSPAEQIRLAYWCEAHGLTAERARHLALAVLADPTNAAARGLLGLVARQDRWVRPEAVASQVQSDPNFAATLAEYGQKRAATAYTADGQWNLAQWADEHGLTAQAKAHYTAVVRLDPARELAWKKLGYKRHDGRWVTDAEIAAQKADADAQKVADKKWKPALEKWKSMLGKASTRAEGEAGLLTVTDPRAVRHVVALFLGGSTPSPAIALRTLSQIDSAAASRWITMIAIQADDPTTRRIAVETLRLRDPRDYAGILIQSLREPVEYEIQRVNGPGSVGKLLIKDSKRKIQRLYATPAVPNSLTWMSQEANGSPVWTYSQFSERVSYQQATKQSTDHFIDDVPRYSVAFQEAGPTTSLISDIQARQRLASEHHAASMSGHPGALAVAPAAHHSGPKPLFDHHFNMSTLTTTRTVTPIETRTSIPVEAMVAEYQKTALVAQQQIVRDASLIDQYNREANASNDRLAMVLRSVSGEDHGTEPAGWTGWMLNLSGYALAESSTTDLPTITVAVPLEYRPQAVPTFQSSFAGPVSKTTAQITSVNAVGDCFGAGTLVRTMTGPQAIETLHAGDLVLTQSTASGALRYQPILMVHHNPPSPTFEIKLVDDTIVSSPFHRFWKVGVGWVMARDIQAGDRLRLLNGTAVVSESRAGDVIRVYNLDVAEDADFFAGATAVLVHDNTLLDPRLIPFDRPSDK